MGDGKIPEQKALEIAREAAVMVLPMNRISIDDAARIEREMRNGAAYSMRRGRHGRAIIIANSEFRRNKPLRGVEVDLQNLQNVLGHLKFSTEVWKNLTLSELISRLEEEKKKSEHREADAFVLCVSSHGNRNHITTTDDKQLDIDSLKTYFDGQMCEGLTGKPKLFIIDTCQGVNSTGGVDYPETVAKDAAKLVPRPRKLHEKNDMSCFYATVPEYVAYDCPRNGSPFIRTLTYVLSRSSHQADWEAMTTEVKNIMTFTEIGDGKLLAPIVDSSLTKTLYLLPRQRLRINVITNGATTIPIDVYDDDTIETVCGRIHQANTGIAVEQMQLLHGDNVELERHKTAGDYGIRANDRITVVVKLAGGF